MRIVCCSLLFCLAALGGWAQLSDSIIPALPVLPEYTDEQPVVVKSGTISFQLTLDGKVEHQLTPDTRRTFTGHAQASSTITLTPSGGTEQVSYTSTATIVEKSTNQKPSTTNVTLNNSYNNKLSELEPGLGPLGPLAMSKKLGAACAWLTAACNENNGGVWQIKDLKGTMESGAFSSPVAGMTAVRIPGYGQTGNVFSRKMNAMEASGKNQFGKPLGGDSYVEMRWTNGGSSGSFSVPVEGICLGYGYMVNTVQALHAMYPAKVIEEDHLVIIPGTLTVTWQLGMQPLKNKLVIAPAKPEQYDKWEPLPHSMQPPDTMPLLVSAKFQPEKKDDPVPHARIDFYLRDVSRHKGECNNAPPDRGMKDDLKFAAEQPEGIVLDPQDPKHAYTKNQEEEAVVAVVAEDGGAYGKLQAECKDLNLIGKYERTGEFSLAIPKDDNANHIADCWEDSMGITKDNLPAEWDDETVSGQQNNGDALTAYEDYRGFRVLKDGQPAYVRLSPKQKALFVIDDGNIFDPALWQHASDITAYKVTSDMVKGGDANEAASRIVDFLNDDGGHKYCVRLEALQGLVEKTAYQNQPPDDLKLYGYTDNQGNSPKTTLRCVVFPARLRAMIDRVAASIDNGLKNPDSDDGQALKAADIPDWLAKKALDRLDQATRAQLAKQMATLCAIHEMGHACGLGGHLTPGEDGKPQESADGDAKCPMKYTDCSENRRLLIQQVIFALDKPLPLQYDHFCQQGYNCYGALNVKD